MKKLLTSILLLLLSFSSFAEWPTKPLTVIVPYAIGGQATNISNAFQQVFEKQFNTPVIVKYMPGGGSMIGVNHVLNEANDDHTIIMLTDDFYISQRMQESKLYEKFTPINMMMVYSFYVYGNSDASIEKLKETIKTKGVINVGNFGPGSSNELWSKQLKYPGLKVNPIPYKGAAPMLADVLGGHLDYGLGIMITNQQLINEGKLKLLMTTGAERNHVYTGVPTYRELGFTGEPHFGFFGLFVRTDTSAEAQEKMAKIFSNIVATDQFFINGSKQGINIVNFGPQRSKKLIDDTVQRIDRMIKNSN